MPSRDAPFEEHLAVLAVLLMRAHGDRIVVTQDEIHDARDLLRDNDVQMVMWDESRLSREVVIEFRHMSRAVLRGEVVRGRQG